MMKKRIEALVTAGVLALSMLTGCGSKQESWKVTCPWAPSGAVSYTHLYPAELRSHILMLSV